MKRPWVKWVQSAVKHYALQRLSNHFLGADLLS
jgi:hypothetical protein